MRVTRLLAPLLLLSLACEGTVSGTDDAGSTTDAAPARDAMARDAEADAALDAATEAMPDGSLDAGTDAGPTTPIVIRGQPLPWEDCEDGGRMLSVGPTDYRDVLAGLQPGDTLQLAPGDYARGLPFEGIAGTAGSCIVVEGTPGGARPRILGSDSFNLVAFRDASWIKVRGLDLAGMGMAGFGVASQGISHHIVVEDLEMVGFDGDQQIVGISTKAPAWDWVIRANRIVGAGTGLYLGNSNGREPFVRGLIEGNLVVNTLGYNMQIKHQIAEGREDLGLAELPREATTIIRYNVFSKAAGANDGANSRPNLLLGHFPRRGSGMNDQYLVYGNLFYENPTEMLFQAEGNVAAYANVFVNSAGGAINVRPHNDVPRRVDIFLNTVIASGRGISVTGGDAGFVQAVRWNVVYGGTGIRGDDVVEENVSGTLEDARAALTMPSGALGTLDLHPVEGALEQTIDLAPVAGYLDHGLDFDGLVRAEVAGAYATRGPGWSLGLRSRFE